MLERKSSMTSMENSQVNTLNNILTSISDEAMSVKSSDIIPTVKTLREGQMVVYDTALIKGIDDGVKRVYFLTNKGNLGFITLT